MNNFEFKETTLAQVKESSGCELLCPVIEADRIAALTGNGLAQIDLNRHISESVSRGCTGAEFDNNSKSIKCPLYGVSVSF